MEAHRANLYLKDNSRIGSCPKLINLTQDSFPPDVGYCSEHFEVQHRLPDSKRPSKSLRN